MTRVTKTIAISLEVLAEIEKLARERNVSMSTMIEILLRDAIKGGVHEHHRYEKRSARVGASSGKSVEG